jgi:hypothetical protein
MFQPPSSRLTPIGASAEAHWSSVSYFAEMASVTTLAVREARGIPSRIAEIVAFLDTKGLSPHLAG